MVAVTLARLQLDGQARHDTTLPSPAASKAAIKHAYTVLFDLANPALAPKIAVIQDGSVLESAMKTALKSALAKSAAGATVSKVTIEHGTACKNELLPSPCATVSYDILEPDEDGCALRRGRRGRLPARALARGQDHDLHAARARELGHRAARLLRPRSPRPNPAAARGRAR